MTLTNTTKSALQELLKHGSIEQSHKPNIYQTLFSEIIAVNQALIPLDLVAEVDDVRGLIFIKVAPPPIEESLEVSNEKSNENQSDADNTTPQTKQNNDDEWTHPLIRKQRLTLEQSLLLAILRQIYIDDEQKQGVGSDNIIAELDDLQSQLQIYLGSSGSDSTDEQKIKRLLEQLASYGVISKLDNNDEVKIRPLIAHIANPSSLAQLLKHIQKLKANI